MLGESCRIHCSVPWSLPGSSLSPSAPSCLSSRFTGAVPRALPKLTSCVLTSMAGPASGETQPAVCIYSCRAPLDKRSPEQVVTNCHLAARHHISPVLARTRPRAGGALSPTTTAVTVLVLNASPLHQPWTERSQDSRFSQSWP